MLLKDFFAHIENHFSKQLPLVFYKKPESLNMKAFLQNSSDVVIVEDFKESGFVFAPFDNNLQTVLIPLNQSESLSSTNESAFMESFSTDMDTQQSEGNESHLKLVKKGIQAISEKQLQKVVLSRCESIALSKTKPISIFKKLIENYPNAFVYCWYHPKIGLWLGATPETLLKVEGNRFKTMALAGTQPYQNSTDVTWQQKEKDEQQFVTDFIVDALHDSVEAISVSDANTIKAGSLLHLQTNISGILKDDLKSVLEVLHPTPAVCGLPVDMAKEFIINHESYQREYYTGFLGELNLKDRMTRNNNKRNVENNAYGLIKSFSHLVVNLRCMQIKNNEALIYVGGGITKDSNPQLEWEETVSKSTIMKRVLIS